MFRVKLVSVDLMRKVLFRQIDYRTQQAVKASSEAEETRHLKRILILGMLVSKVRRGRCFIVGGRLYIVWGK